MTRKNKTMKEIEELCKRNNLDMLTAFEKAKAVLKIYRKVVWSVKTHTSDIVCEELSYYGSSIDEALSFLTTFAPERDRQEFEERVCGLFETKWLIDIVERSLTKIRHYPVYGQLYHDILKKYFIDEEHITNDTCMLKFNLEKTIYFQRKKEAIALMGIAIWGYALPNLLKEIQGNSYETKRDKIKLKEITNIYFNDSLRRSAN